jgi:hypothetical protein
MRAYYTLSSPAVYDSLEVRPYDDLVFSIYGHIEGEGFECIGDFNSFDAACSVAEKLGGKLVKKILDTDHN